MRVEVDQIGKHSLERAELLLAGFPGAIDKAIQSTMRRTASHVRAKSSKRIRERYAISNNNLRTDSSVKISYNYSPGDGAKAAIIFSGAKIPLYRFEGAAPSVPSFDESRMVRVRTTGGWKTVHPGTAARSHQLKGTSPTLFKGAFVARFASGHIGIFEQTGGATSSGADELRELMGSSIPQMLGSSEVLTGLSKDAKDEFDKRMTHEVDAILNGWR